MTDKSKFRPIRASKVELGKLCYPVAVQPKLDGIRALMIGGVLFSRSMKPIPNKFIQEWAFEEFTRSNGLVDELDGELMIDGDFNDVQSAVMSESGEPDFKYIVFDRFTSDEEPYYKRWVNTKSILVSNSSDRIHLLESMVAHDEGTITTLFDHYIREGYEGAMIRDPNGPYKFGQSTVKEGYLLKMKPLDDSEGRIVEIVEAMHNGNKVDKDAFGLTKRSSHKENKTGLGKAGAIVVKLDNGKTCKLGMGEGIKDSDKVDLWDNRGQLVGKLARFTYQGLSKGGIPRFPKFINIRDERDMIWTT